MWALDGKLFHLNGFGGSHSTERRAHRWDEKRLSIECNFTRHEGDRSARPEIIARLRSKAANLCIKVIIAAEGIDRWCLHTRREVHDSKSNFLSGLRSNDNLHASNLCRTWLQWINRDIRPHSSPLSNKFIWKLLHTRPELKTKWNPSTGYRWWSRKWGKMLENSDRNSRIINNSRGCWYTIYTTSV